MIAKESIDRLREHSGLVVPTRQLISETFVDCVHAIRNGALESGLEGAVTDVIGCLERLNSCNKGGPEAQRSLMSLDITYAISGMTVSAIECSIQVCKTGRKLIELLSAIWRITAAWDAVLAGDIENIAEHTQLEAAAKLT